MEKSAGRSGKKGLASLLDGDLKIVEKRKIWFMIPAAVIALALVFGIIWGFVFGSPLNLSMDFAGGYSMTLNLSTKLTDESFPIYEQRINEIAGSLSDADGNEYGLKIEKPMRQGDGADASVLIKYKAVKSVGREESDYMKEVNERFKEELDKLFVYMPAVTLASGKITAVYSDPVMDSVVSVIRDQAAEQGVSITDVTISQDRKTLTVQHTGTVTAEKAAEFLTVADKFSGKATEGDVTGAVISTELLVDAILAILLALTLMLVYIMFRFEVSSGFAAVFALIHDITIMFAFMVIFAPLGIAEIGSSFIAALITILGYSINNTIILFDRVREKLKPFGNKMYDPDRIANESVRDTFKRSLFTTITTLIPITMIALIGVASIRNFAFPIIVGLIAGTYSSVVISPSIWAMWKNRLFKKNPGGVPGAAKPAEPVAQEQPLAENAQ